MNVKGSRNAERMIAGLLIAKRDNLSALVIDNF
jgi:hypothetical protein